MKSLVVLRHAKSSWEDRALSDRDRPLDQRGRHAAQRMGRLIAELSLYPDFVWCSPSVRTRETWRLVAKALPAEFEPTVVDRDELYHAAPETLLQIIRETPASCETLLVVGHNPGLEEFVSLLSGREERFPTAALAHFTLELDDWSQFSLKTQTRLEGLWRPKELE